MDVLTRIVVPGAASESWLGSELVTPTNPAGLSAGTVSGTTLQLDAANEAGGTPPNAGLSWVVGRHRVTFDLSWSTALDVGGIDFDCRVRNITDSNNAVTQSFVEEGQFRKRITMEFDSVAAKSYQGQVVVTAVSTGAKLSVFSMAHDSIPYLAQNEQAHTEPESGIVHKRDSSGNLVSVLSNEGEVPFYLPPGLTAIFIIPLDAPLPGYTEPQSVKGRTVTVSAIGAPRYTG